MQVEITKEEYERLAAICELSEQAEVDAAAASNRNALLAQLRANWLTALGREYNIPQQAHLSFLREGNVYSVKSNDTSRRDQPTTQPRQQRESFVIDSDQSFYPLQPSQYDEAPF